MTEYGRPSLAGQRAVVVGAAGGIGSAVVAELLSCGAEVLGVDIAEPTPGTPAACRMLIGDATDDATVARAMTAINPTLLVMATISQQPEPLRDAHEAGFLRAYDVMTVSAWRWASALVGQLDGRPGAIVNITSVHAHGAVENFGPYSAAKAALEALTRTMAVEWGLLGVRCNAVAPGLVLVDRNRAAVQDPAESARLLSRYPLGRFADAEDVARTIRFLLSADAAAITGVCLPVDGGLLARLP